MRSTQTVLSAMAAYYALTGSWPLLHMRSFERVTGPKKDRWLVDTVGALIVANAVALAVAARREPAGAVGRALAIGDALAFIAIDVVFVARRTIRPIYLADAVVELAFLAALATAG